MVMEHDFTSFTDEDEDKQKINQILRADPILLEGEIMEEHMYVTKYVSASNLNQSYGKITLDPVVNIQGILYYKLFKMIIQVEIVIPCL